MGLAPFCNCIKCSKYFTPLALFVFQISSIFWAVALSDMHEHIPEFFWNPESIWQTIERSRKNFVLRVFICFNIKLQVDSDLKPFLLDLYTRSSTCALINTNTAQPLPWTYSWILGEIVTTLKATQAFQDIPHLFCWKFISHSFVGPHSQWCSFSLLAKPWPARSFQSQYFSKSMRLYVGSNSCAYSPVSELYHSMRPIYDKTAFNDCAYIFLTSRR